MEEILASIRRIISDENSAATAQTASAPPPASAPAAAPKPAAPPPAAKKPAPPPPPPPPPAAAQEEEADVLELTEMVETKADRADDVFRRPEPPADVMFRDPEPVREPARYSPPSPRTDEQIMSQQTSAAVSSAFSALSHSMFSGDSRTVDELVREMLRPMLKAWLDDNLPGLVERLVRAEIERVSRGR